MRRWLALLFCGIAVFPFGALAELPGFIKLKDGYFYDAVTGEPWVPHGIAYQTWNRPLGVWQTHEQIDYDLDEMKKMGANSIRVDFVWQHIEEDGDNQFKWDNYDYLVQAAEARDIRIFALIGYQWPPNWFPDEWYTKHPPAFDSEGIYHPTRWPSDIINYEHPDARAQYAEWFQNVCSRYENSKAIVGWIIGNESGYLGLWSGLLDGYDPESEAAFRAWSAAKYGTIENCNARWGTAYTNFNDIVFVEQYREYGVEGAQWADMVQWREDSIGTFTAIGAKAAKAADTNHLIAYSTVGMQWGEEDWRYHAEDRGKITLACERTNAPVDFFAVNNYPWSILGHESQNGHWGISYTKKVTGTPLRPEGVPVLYSETGFTSSETMWPGMNEARQGPLVRNSLWESLEAGANGTHIFAWHDRPYITDREKGFGILTAERRIKAAFWDSMNSFQLMKQMQIGRVLMGSKDPRPDIGFLWTAANDSQYNRYECEMQQIAGACERLGYEPNFVNLDDLGSGAYTNFRILVLPRNMRVDRAVPNSTNKPVLRFLLEDVLAKGVHVLASADIPGIQDENGRPIPEYTNDVKLLFGIDASDVGGYEVPPRTGTFILENMKRIRVTFTNAPGPITNGYTATPAVWKYNDEIKADGGTVWAMMDSGRNKGFEINNSWPEKWGSWSNVMIQRDWDWVFDGRNMLQMWGDSGVYQSWGIVPFGHYVFSAYLRHNAGDPLRDGSAACLEVKWTGKDGRYLGVTRSPELSAGSTTDAWLPFKVDALAPSNAWDMTRHIRVGPRNLLVNGDLDAGTGGYDIYNDSGLCADCTVYTWSGNWGCTTLDQNSTDGSPPEGTKCFKSSSCTWAGWGIFRTSGTADMSTYAGGTLKFKLKSWQAHRIEMEGPQGTKSQVWVPSTAGAWQDVAIPLSSFSTVDLAQVHGFFTLPMDGAGSNFVDNIRWERGAGPAPAGWAQWNEDSHDPCTTVYAGTSGNAWAFWWDGGIYQEVTNGFSAGDTLKFGGYMYTPVQDRLRNGTKHGAIQLEFYNGGTLLSTVSTWSNIWWGTTNDVWVPFDGVTSVPAGANRIRFLVRCNDASSGDGRFVVDDVYLRNGSRGAGSVFVDNDQESPALVVKDHGTAKAAIFLFTAGDTASDGSGDGEMDVLPWQWRYDYFGAVIRDYFGCPPKIRVLGTNAFLCLAEYRTCTNGATMWQVKNYMYDRFVYDPPGGPDQTFTIQSSLFTGRTIRAYEQGRIIETNSDGTITLTLKPDGHEMLLAYLPSAAPQQVVQLSSAPSVVHPGGDRVYQVQVQYDCLAATGLVVKAAFKEVGDNGDGTPDEIYHIQTNAAAGSGTVNFYMWIPPARQDDADYISTPDGGNYQFAAWLENAGGQVVVEAVPRDVVLEWGVRPTAPLPTNMTKGATVNLPFEWEELYEPHYWEMTPLARNDGYPSRVGLLRSSKTDAQYPGHFARANEAADWLESMGYVAGNPLDLAFDNVKVEGTFSDDFEDGNYNGWVRAAGCANWEVQNAPVLHGMPLRYDATASYSLNGAAKRLSFKVTADANNTVDTVYLYARYYGSCPTYRLDVYKDSGGVPAGASLASATFTAPAATYQWVAVDLPDFRWSGGTMYHFVLSHAGGTINGSNYMRVQYVGPATAGRRVLYSANSGATWTEQDREPTLRIRCAGHSWLAQPYASYSSVAVLGGTRYGQRFQLGESVNVTNVAVFLRKQSTVNGNVRLQLRRWSNKAVLATSTVSRTLVRTTNDWITFTFSPPVLLGGGTQHFFEIINLGSTGYYYAVRENALGAGGVYTWDSTTNCTVYSVNTGATWSTQAHYDLGYVLNGDSKNLALRTWRIGNSDNIMLRTGVYTNFAVSTDIRYNRQDNYFDDAEVYYRYKDRGTYYRVGIRNYYAFWRLKYTVLVNSNIVQQGWIHDFAKTNRPIEKEWYNLKIEVNGSTNKVFFDGRHVGTFWDTNIASGAVGVGSRALQLGNWEPPKGYYFVDDDEWTFWAPEGQPQTTGRPVNLDWGYLTAYFNTMVLPSVYVMSDLEVSNVATWLNSALNSLVVFDGGLAMKNETGAYDLGRIEPLLGVQPVTLSLGGASQLTVGPEDHYVTLDYSPGAHLAAKGSGTSYALPDAGEALGTVSSATSAAPALIANVLLEDPVVPKKVFCFNYPVDTQGQLTNEARTIARRAFEWARGDAFKCKVALMYDAGGDPQYDFAVCETNAWILAGSGSNTVAFTLPTDGLMTGTNLYWAYTVYPWNIGEWWAMHQGFYSSDTEGRYVTLPGQGLQIIYGDENIYGGRDWAVWLAYNTDGQTNILTYGVKDKGALQDEDNFNDGNYNGWSVVAHPNISWKVTNGALRATVVSTGGYAYIYRDGLDLAETNLTLEYYTRFMNGAKHGGAIYRGTVLYVNPEHCGWADISPALHTNVTWLTTGGWHHVVINIRDGDPFMRSDLVVDGRFVFMDEPIEVTGHSTNTFGFLSPYAPGCVEWDHVRVSDEQYSFVTQRVCGVYTPTGEISDYYAIVPDYDPDMWEHEGTTLGAAYEWYAYLAGGAVHDAYDTVVRFAPRIMVEDTNFPAEFNPGQTVQLPVEWEHLPEVPMALTYILQDVWSATVYATNTMWLWATNGTALLPVDIPEQTPSGDGFQWSVFVYPTNASDPWIARLGADDTFRYGRDGIAAQAETLVVGSAIVNGDLVVYRDLGIPAGCDIYTWEGGAATFDGDYAGGGPPEGSKCFRTYCSSWAGWGIFSVTGAVDITEYRDGFLKFWLRSMATVKVDIEQWSGTKATKYIPTTSNVWKEIVIPVSDFAGVDLAQVKGLFEVTTDTATTFYIDHIRYVKGIFPVYTDAGVPDLSAVTTWAGGAAAFDPHYEGGAAPEGSECFLATGAVSAGWGVVMTNGVMDMHLYTNGFLCFWARTPTRLKVQIEVPQGTTRTTYINSTTNTWQEMRIPLGTFGGFNYRQVYGLFKVTATNAATFMIDNVTWKKGTNAVPSEQKETFYSDAGIPDGTDVFVWKASTYWTHISSAVRDGGLESSTAGAFPDSGYWTMAGAGGGATAQCLAAAANTGLKGLRAQTGSGTSATWVGAYQEHVAYAGDIFRAQAYVRQPSGTGWTAGSVAYLRVRFVDAWHQPLGSYTSLTTVVTAGQGWTLCASPVVTAPFNTRFVQCEVVVQKPSGAGGVSVADFDDVWLGQANSFSGEYTEDPVTPEGTRCFRSYCVSWSGWGVFYTNGVTNLSQYATGYLKFWYKSSNYTKIEVQSQWNGVTITRAYPASGYFGPTLDGGGNVVWQQKCIPISHFAGVDLLHIKSPFMVTDPTYDNGFYVDDVRWTMSP